MQRFDILIHRFPQKAYTDAPRSGIGVKCCGGGDTGGIEDDVLAVLSRFDTAHTRITPGCQ